jgi:hypothetical protein
MKAVSARTAGRLTREALAEMGLSNRVTARTVSFSDLARAKRVYVAVHGWRTDPRAVARLYLLGREHNFSVEFFA